MAELGEGYYVCANAHRACVNNLSKSMLFFSPRHMLQQQKNMEKLESLAVSELNEFLEEQGISSKTLQNFTSNMVSGLALQH